MAMGRITAIKQAVEAAYAASEREARTGSKYVHSRGKFVGTADNRGEQSRPYIGAEAHDWKGTEKQLREAVEEILRNYPNVEKLYLEGGFDGADNFRAYCDGDYCPWVSSWAVTVWTRKEGWKF